MLFAWWLLSRNFEDKSPTIRFESTLKSPFLGGFKTKPTTLIWVLVVDTSTYILHIYTVIVSIDNPLAACDCFHANQNLSHDSCTTSTDIWRGQLNDLAIYLQRLCKAFHGGSGGVMCCEFCANDVRPSPFLVRKVIFPFQSVKSCSYFLSTMKSPKIFWIDPLGVLDLQAGLLKFTSGLVQEPLCWTSRARGDGVAFCEPHPGQ